MSIFDNFSLYKKINSDRLVFAARVKNNNDIEELKNEVTTIRPKTENGPKIGDMIISSPYGFHYTTPHMFNRRYKELR